MIQIKHQYTDNVLFEHDGDSVRDAVVAAVDAGANLADADLTDANLADANLTRANLAGANLAGANLAGAAYGESVPMTKPPVQLLGLRWPVMVLDDHVKIGCQLHTTEAWRGFDDHQIAEMDGREALRFWNAHRDVILALAEVHQK